MTRATSYGSATSAQSPHEAPEVSQVAGLGEEHAENDAFADEDSYINLEATMIEAREESDASHTASSRTLSFDEHTGLSKPSDAGPSTPLHTGNAATPKTIFQTAQKDVFKSAFKSAAKERDIFMTAKPNRTRTALDAEEYESSPTLDASVDDSSVTLSFDRVSHGTPSVASKRDTEEDEEDSYVHIGSVVKASKRRRTSRPLGSEEQTLAVIDPSSGNERLATSPRVIAELDTTGLSDDETSGFSSSDSWSLDTPPPGLDRKGRKNWKRQQRRSKASAMEHTYGNRKPKVGKRPVARTGFRRSVSGRDVLIGHARRRFWEGRLADEIYCC